MEKEGRSKEEEGFDKAAKIRSGLEKKSSVASLVHYCRYDTPRTRLVASPSSSLLVTFSRLSAEMLRLCLNILAFLFSTKKILEIPIDDWEK